MKKLLEIVVLGLLLIANIAEAKTTKFIKGEFYEGTVIWQSIEIDLPPGEWQHVSSSSWYVRNYGYTEWTFVQTENNRWKADYSLLIFHTGGKYLWYLGPALLNYYKRGKYDNCTLRPEYYAAKLYAKGNSSNCFLVAHREVYKELYNPDDPELRGSNIAFKQWIKKNNIELPAIVVCRSHTYYSAVVRDVAVELSHCIDPEFFGATKSKFETEERSEYHRHNIENYPEKKKFMEQWTSSAAEYHKEFEERVRARDYHRLDLSEYYAGKNSQTLGTFSQSITEELKELKKLYDDGVLTKEEFTKAKKKLLN